MLSATATITTHVLYKLVLAELLRRAELATIDETVYLLGKLRKNIETNEFIKSTSPVNPRI